MADCMTKDSEQARNGYNLRVQRKSWKLMSEKSRRLKGLDALAGYDDEGDAWMIIPESWLQEPEEEPLPADSRKLHVARATQSHRFESEEACAVHSSVHVDPIADSSKQPCTA